MGCYKLYFFLLILGSHGQIWDPISKIDRDNEIQNFISAQHFALCTSRKRPFLAQFLR